METPLQITLRGMPHSDALNERIRDEASKLEKYCDRLLVCHVVVDKPHRHHRGSHFTVRLDISMPGNEFVINRDHDEDVQAALHSAFQAAGRQLKEYQRRRRDLAVPRASMDMP